MKRKIIASLLSVSMLCSLLPTFVFATSTEGDTTPTETLSAACPTCGQENCQLTHENWCEICNTDDCTETHVFCQTCQKYDCGEDHTVMPTNEGGEGDGEPAAFIDQLLGATTLKQLTTLLEDTNNNTEIAALTFDQLTEVEGVVETLYNASNKDEAATNKYTWLKGTLNNLKALAANTFEQLLETCTCTADKSRYVVHDSNCNAYIPLPGAKVTALPEITQVDAMNGIGGIELKDVPVTFAMQFATLESYEEKQLEYYGPWRSDFVITTNKTITGKDAYLIGAYDLYQGGDWVKISLNETDTLPAGEPLRLISGITDWASLFTFENVNSMLKTFKCGIWVDPEYLAKPENVGFSVKVELKLYPVDANNDCDYSKSYTLSEINYQSENAVIKYEPSTGGTLSNNEETVGTLVKPAGSTPTPMDGYHFVGWYTDATYDTAVPSKWVSDDNTLTPGTNENGTYDSATYYAKFVSDSTDVTLKVEVSGDTSEEASGDTYLFVLSGRTFEGETVNLQFAAKSADEIKIAGLPAGDYTVEPVAGWNWREELGSDKLGDMTDGESDVTISATNPKSKWLSAYAYAKKVIG